MFKPVKRYYNTVSKITFLALFVVVVWTVFNLKRWENLDNSNKIITADVVSYYAYLPAIFVYNDIKLDFLDDPKISNIDKQLFWPERLNEKLEKDDQGKIRVIKTTMGMSILYAPFFFMGYGYSYLSGGETNGFSEIYTFFLVMSCLFYFFIGLFYLRKLLLLNFSELVTTATMISIVMGTNLFYYVIEDSAMSHAYSFSLIIGFIYQSIHWVNSGTLKRAIYIGLLGGLIMLIRPVNIFIFIFPLLYGVYAKKLLITRMQFFLANYTHIITIGVLSFLVLFPQLLYWKYITGSWFFNSYVGEQFYFGNPHVLEGLFSYRNGWLLYTPLMIFAIIGIVLLRKHQKNYFLPISIFFLINTYVLYSWWCWWYGGSFGSRPMIDSYGLMAIPLACFYSFALNKKYVRQIVVVVSFLLVSFNQFQTFQRRRTLIHWDSMTKDAYWDVFLKRGISQSEWVLHNNHLKEPDYSKARAGKEEYTQTK